VSWKLRVVEVACRIRSRARRTTSRALRVVGEEGAIFPGGRQEGVRRGDQEGAEQVWARGVGGSVHVRNPIFSAAWNSVMTENATIRLLVITENTTLPVVLTHVVPRKPADESLG
jgi:hypothetical protein